MIFTEYTDLARRTLKVTSFRDHMIHMSAGITGEYGEIIDGEKKVAIYGKVPDPVNRTEEVGDDFWYIACACSELLVHPMAVQVAIDSGLAEGIKERGKITSAMDLLANVVQINLAVASLATNVMSAKEPGDQLAMDSLINLGRVMGVTCALLEVDPVLAMQANIDKLQRRYPDAFTSEAALNRDLGAERAGLEAAVNGSETPGAGDAVTGDGSGTAAPQAPDSTQS